MKQEDDVVKRIVSILRQEGATRVEVIPASGIVIDERVRLKCQVPLCDSYNRNLTCPPHAPSIDAFRKTLSLYTNAVIVQVSQPFDGVSDDAFALANRLHELINWGETEAFKAGYRFAVGLIGSCCRLCEECAAVNPGERCRFPFKARPSMSAMGIDVIATTEKAGLSVKFPVTDAVTWTGVILL